MNISAPFILRPVATSLLTLGLLLLGVLAFRLLPVAPLPTVDFPTVQVSAQLPGASPEVMASSVTTPLEHQLGRIAGLTSMVSTSSFGIMTNTLQFTLGRNIDSAAQDVQSAINATAGQLPKTLPAPPSYNKVNPADTPILVLAVTSDEMPLPRAARLCRNLAGAEAEPGGRRRPGVHPGRAEAGGAHPGQPDGDRQHRAGSGRGSHPGAGGERRPA